MSINYPLSPFRIKSIVSFDYSTLEVNQRRKSVGKASVYPVLTQQGKIQSITDGKPLK